MNIFKNNYLEIWSGIEYPVYMASESPNFRFLCCDGTCTFWESDEQLNLSSFSFNWPLLLSSWSTCLSSSWASSAFRFLPRRRVSCSLISKSLSCSSIGTSWLILIEGLRKDEVPELCGSSIEQVRTKKVGITRPNFDRDRDYSPEFSDFIIRFTKVKQYRTAVLIAKNGTGAESGLILL